MGRWQPTEVLGRAGLAWPALAVLCAYYAVLLTNGDFRPFAPEFLGLAFNSQLSHLLHGTFTVDPKTIGYEAFIRDGKVYSYFGILPALLRGLFAPFVDLQHTYVARISCLAATLLIAVFQVRMYRAAWATLAHDAPTRTLYVLVLAALLLGGPQLFLLAAAPVYHEPILWAVALCSMFSYLLVAHAFESNPLGARRLAWMALLAGLYLITRVTEAVALYLVMGVLLVHAAIRSGRSPDAVGDAASRRRRILVPLLILGVFGLAQLGVNQARWGNPLTFADLRAHAFMMSDPDRVRNLDAYGPFAVSRMPHNLAYYLVGSREPIRFIAALWPTDFDAKQKTLAPLALDSPLILVLAVFGLWRVVRGRTPEIIGRWPLGIGLLGLSFPVLFLLGYMHLAVRFHMDALPFLSLAALVGFHQLATAMAGTTTAERWRVVIPAAMLSGVGIAASHVALAYYKVSWLAPDHETKLWIVKWFTE